jgi:limonene-1,2-epoxide hydrolase
VLNETVKRSPPIYIEIDTSQSMVAMSRTLAMEIAPPDPGAIDVVLRFCAAWDRLDMDSVVALLGDDIVYHNIPVEPLIGKAAVEAYLRAAGPFDSCRWELVAIAANGGTVLTERVDRFIIKDQAIALPVSGTFEVADGRIIKWRDYFDLASYRAQLPAKETA